MAIADTVKDIKPSQWLLIAGAGLGLGLLLRMRSKAKGAVAKVTTDTPSTLNDTQGYSNYSGTGQTGWAGGAIIDPNATSQQPAPPVAVAPVTTPAPAPPAPQPAPPVPVAAPTAETGHQWSPTGQIMPTPVPVQTYTYWLSNGQPVTVPITTPMPVGAYDAPPSTWGR